MICLLCGSFVESYLTTVKRSPIIWALIDFILHICLFIQMLLSMKGFAYSIIKIKRVTLRDYRSLETLISLRQVESISHSVVFCKNTLHQSYCALVPKVSYHYYLLLTIT